MHAWVQTGAAPPESRYPKIADGTLVPIEKLHFPAIAGMKPPASAAQGWDLDFGDNWRGGVLSMQPPAEVAAYPTLVPQVNADGTDEGGVELPEIQAPLATYTGWNLRAASIGAPGERTAFQGSFVPFARTKAEADAKGDPRVAIESRYKDYAEYRARFERAVGELVAERYILPEDRDHVNERSKEEWDWAVVQP